MKWWIIGFLLILSCGCTSEEVDGITTTEDEERLTIDLSDSGLEEEEVKEVVNKLEAMVEKAESKMEDEDAQEAKNSDLGEFQAAIDQYEESNKQSE